MSKVNQETTRQYGTTKQYLESVTLPVYTTGKYVVVTHKHIMDTSLKLLSDNNLIVEKELYSSCQSGNIGTGKYYIKDSSDPELGMMFTWTNSYDKTVKFKCAIGGYGAVSQNTYISGNMSSWTRKHMGTVLAETDKIIENQIINAHIYFKDLLDDKKLMTLIKLTAKERAEILGRLVFEKNIIGIDQVSIIRGELEKSSFDYGYPNTLWELYNHISHSIKRIIPRYWMEKQRQLHFFFNNEFLTGSGNIHNISLNTPVMSTVNTVSPLQDKIAGSIASVYMDPAQIDLEDSIKEIESGYNDFGTDNIGKPDIDDSETDDEEIGGSKYNLDNLNEALKEEIIEESDSPFKDDPETTVEDELDMENHDVDLEKTMDQANPETYDKPKRGRPKKVVTEIETSNSIQTDKFYITGEELLNKLSENEKIAKTIITENIEKLIEEEKVNVHKESGHPKKKSSILSEEEQLAEENELTQEQLDLIEANTKAFLEKDKSKIDFNL